MNGPFAHRCAAEFLGTAAIVLCPVALAASTRLPGSDGGLAVAALASGLPVGAMILALGPVSGAHLNPAVSVALAAARRFPLREVPGYIAAQCAGGVAAAGLASALLGPGRNGAHIPTVSMVSAVAIEAVLTFLLVLVVFGSAIDPRARAGSAAPAITMAVVANVMVGGAATGGSMNTARSLGPALWAGGECLSALWIYFLGPVLGALVAALVWQHGLGGRGVDRTIQS
ncbi:MAG: MIP/aquaporin family protein [Armatimonadota bacterium]